MNAFLNFLFPSLVFIFNLHIQNYNLGKLVYTFTDEGVYLYSAKLISQGLIPYKDFFLSQPVYGLLPVSLFFKLCGNNLNLLHFFYSIWVFTAIFPIYFLLVRWTNNRFVSSLVLLFYSTFPEMVQWDSHSFALRQFSLPLLAFALLFKNKNRYFWTGVLLGLFSIILVINFFIASSFIICIFIVQIIKNKSAFSVAIYKNRWLLITFFSICLLGYGIIFLIPSGFNNVVGYQTQRPYLSLNTRFAWILAYSLPTNWPIIIGGLLSSIFLINKIPFLAIFNLLTFFITIFLGNYFYPHYLVSIAVGFSLSFGIVIARMTNRWLSKFIFFIALILVFYLSSFSSLKKNLIDTTSPQFFRITGNLMNTPSTLFSLEPIYALYSNKELTYHYHVADMRYFRVLGNNLDDKEYLDILGRSKTVLLEPFANGFIPQAILKYIYKTYQLIYTDGINSIYVKK